MAQRITEQTKQFLLNVELPKKTESYTPISHEFAINNINLNLLNNNFLVKKESYRSTANGNIANGVFELNRMEDDSMQMICCFSNSYDKSTRFSVAIGAKVIETGNYFLSDISWIRKHSGKADTEAVNVIKKQIESAEDYFKKLIDIKKEMEKICCNKKRYGALIGQLFINELLSVEQISICFKRWREMEIKDPECECINLWKAYGFIQEAQMETHPSKWIQNQILTNMYILDMFNIKVYLSSTQLEIDVKEKDEIILPDENTEPVLEIQNELIEEETEEEIKEFKDEEIEEPVNTELIEINNNEEIPEEIIKEIPEDITEEIPEEITKEIPEEIIEEIPETLNESEVNETIQEQEDYNFENINEEIKSFEPIRVTDQNILDKIDVFLQEQGIDSYFSAIKYESEYEIHTSESLINIPKDIIK